MLRTSPILAMLYFDDVEVEKYREGVGRNEIFPLQDSVAGVVLLY